MATRSIIGQVQEEGNIKAIYCHYDGYLSGVGQTLAEHYSNPEKVTALMNLGDLSSLREEIGEKHDFNTTPEEPWCTAYGRDRGETGIEAKEFKTVEELIQYGNEAGAEFIYLFGDAEGWNYYEPNTRFKKIKPSNLVEA